MTTDDTAIPHEGWAYPTASARKPHYFRTPDGPMLRSLCGRYGIFADLMPPGSITPDTGVTSPSDCAACSRKLEAGRA